jgi:superfamily II DNA or RNA helicase
MIELRPLRPPQQKLVDEIHEAWDEGHNRVMVQAPCGFGKTLTAAYLIRDAIEEGKRVCFITPRLTLVDQTVNAYGAEGFADHIGVIQGKHPLTNYKKLLQIASLQTLTRRTLPHIDLMIVDEAHMMTKAFLKLLRENKDVSVLGLSATPWSSGLGKYYDKLIEGRDTTGLIEDGYLVNFRTYAPAKPLKLDKIKIVSGDYHQGELSKEVNKSEIVGDVVEHYKKYGEDRPSICFAVDRAHAKHLQQRFNEAGIAAGYVDCFTNDLDRRELIQDFREGKIQVICNVGVLTTGFDAPEASCMIDAAPTKSLILHVQKTGRVLRTAKSKTDAILLDHAGNTLKLGLITDIHRHSLCSGDPASRAIRKEQERTDPKPALCEECKTVMAQHHTHCPQCGTIRKAYTKVFHQPGELTLDGAGGPTNLSDLSKEMANFYAELRFIVAQRGYKEGWASYKFKERYGNWPNVFKVPYLPVKKPTIDTLNWIKSKQIAWSKTKAKTEGYPSLIA